MVDTCYTGGAPGADNWWGIKAAEAGHRVIAYSFEGHRFVGPSNWRVVLTEGELQEGLAPLKNVLAQFGFNLSTNQYIKNLLLRDYWQVRNTQAVYAVGYITDGRVEGGTAYAVAMFANMLRAEDPNMALAPIYLFCLTKKHWLQYDIFSDRWAGIDKPPRPSGNWTGIGTRRFNNLGRAAINEVFHG